MQQSLIERHSGKTKQMTNWSVSTFKGKLNFFCFKIVKYKTRAFNRKFEIKPIPILLNRDLQIGLRVQHWVRVRLFNASYCCPFFASDLMHNSTGHKTIGSCFKLCTIESWSTWAVWRALKKLEFPSATPRATITLLSCSPNFPRAP